MWNEDQKKRYIAYKTERVTIDRFFLPGLFAKTEPFEKRFKKDLCCFTTEEIVNMYKMMNFYTFSSIDVTNSAYKLYAAWCLKEGLVFDGQNHFEELYGEQLWSCLNPTIIGMNSLTREDILDKIPYLLNPSDQFLLLGLFEGIGGKYFSEFCSLVKDDIDPGRNLIRIKGRGILPFSHTLCALGVEAAEEPYHYFLNPKRRDRVLFLPSDKVIKDYPNSKIDSPKQNGRRVYMRVSRIVDQLYPEGYLRANLIRNAGIASFVAEKAGKLGISQEAYTDTHGEEVKNQFGPSLRGSFIKTILRERSFAKEALYA